MISHIEDLIKYQIDKKTINVRDYIYVKNVLCSLLGENPKNHATPKTISYVASTLNEIVNILKEKGNKYTFLEEERLKETIMNVFASLPSEIENHFYSLYNKNKISATTWFYEFCKNVYYIKQDRIDKNIIYKPQLSDVLLTINLSKPEKDPQEIAAALNNSNTDIYPLCHLCIEHEGYNGNYKYDSRITHRIIKLNLNKHNYYFQYSPYSYYNEHCIVLNEEHTPMFVNKRTINNLLVLCDKFPSYFFGSNADIPYVGGSILTHDHYQGGKFNFPIEKAKITHTFIVGNVTYSVINWHLSTIRLSSNNIDDLINAFDLINTKWLEYNNPKANIISNTLQTRHNAITPIARKKQSIYELDLVLRNNRTTAEYPLGIFHPHSDMWAIKKENIGLIEVMGLAILPARLKEEIETIKKCLLNNEKLSENVIKHESWVKNITTYSKNTIDGLIFEEIGKMFVKCLDYCKVLDNKLLIEFLEGVIKYERTSTK
ncbi:MAG: UDP-glucose--hexose-1-phosphate uridylyltransferase [Acholeplasmatales bacterium]|jgi:UDPglucose--hexose-1-phosphate uridylyltransferase|nr:UDP-glucose--hexose-1-phosphate uridylyltransferase [Acholeplasmatales bacterium]